MTRLLFQSAGFALLATVLSGGGRLFAQARAPKDVRWELTKLRDIEHQLSVVIVNGVEAKFTGLPAPSINFHSGGVISGFGGVNRYFAGMEVTRDGSFRWEAPGFAVTKVVGEQGMMDAEGAFLNALQSTRFIRLESDGITMESEDHATTLKFTRTTLTEDASQAIAKLLNRDLFLVRFVATGMEIPLPPTVAITLQFQEGGRITGQSAVNSYSGVFVAAPDGSITLQPTNATQIGGPPELMQLEAAYFDALSTLRRIHPGPAEVVLESEDNTTSMHFTFNP